MKVYGFNSNNRLSCGGSDTRFMSNTELLGKLHIELKSAKADLAKLEEEMQMLANLHNNYYDMKIAVGICFIEIDSVNSKILDLNSKIKHLKETK